MSPVLTLTVAKVMFLIVVGPPGLVNLLDLRPGPRIGKREIGEPALNREQGLCKILSGLPRIDALFANTQHIIELHSNG